jgi:hypothetical protein
MLRESCSHHYLDMTSFNYVSQHATIVVQLPNTMMSPGNLYSAHGFAHAKPKMYRLTKPINGYMSQVNTLRILFRVGNHIRYWATVVGPQRRICRVGHRIKSG